MLPRRAGHGVPGAMLADRLGGVVAARMLLRLLLLYLLVVNHQPSHALQGWPECHAHAVHLQFWSDAFPTEPRHCSGHHRSPRLGVHAPPARWPRGAWGHAGWRLGGVVAARMLLRILFLYLLVVDHPPSHAL